MSSVIVHPVSVPMSVPILIAITLNWRTSCQKLTQSTR